MIKGTFLNNKEYGATEIADRLSKYVTQGIADPFNNGEPYNTSILNNMTIPLYERGVVPSTDNSLKCSRNKTTKKVTINSGLCFFANGTTLEATSPETKDYVAGVKNYVYAYSNLTTNTIDLFCSTIEPTGDCVMLAEISANETLTDKRLYATGKIPGYGSDFNMAKKWGFTNKTVPSILDLGGTNYNCVVVVGSYSTGKMCCGIWESETNTYFSVATTATYGKVETDRLLYEYNYLGNKSHLIFDLIGSDLHITNVSHSPGDIPFTLYVF